jgi:hypothetical protein
MSVYGQSIFSAYLWVLLNFLFQSMSKYFRSQSVFILNFKLCCSAQFYFLSSHCTVCAAQWSMIMMFSTPVNRIKSSGYRQILPHILCKIPVPVLTLSFSCPSMFRLVPSSRFTFCGGTHFKFCTVATKSELFRCSCSHTHTEASWTVLLDHELLTKRYWVTLTTLWNYPFEINCPDCFL